MERTFEGARDCACMFLIVVGVLNPDIFWGGKTPGHSAPYRREASLQHLNSPIDPELGKRKHCLYPALTELCCTVQGCCQDSRYGNQDSPSVRLLGQKAPPSIIHLFLPHDFALVFIPVAAD